MNLQTSLVLELILVRTYHDGIYDGTHRWVSADAIVNGTPHRVLFLIPLNQTLPVASRSIKLSGSWKSWPSSDGRLYLHQQSHS